MLRDKGCGEIRETDIGNTVTLAGWVFRRRDHGGLIFIDLRDRTGLGQVVFSSDTDPASHEAAHALRSEYVIKITGKVSTRPEGTENTSLPTGMVEIYVEQLEVLNESEPLPFVIEDAGDTSEQLRLKHRYLDLRRPEMQQNLIVRHRASKCMRDYLDEQGFIEIETPMLTKSTPEGARDYLVPSRPNPGQFFALPQSPQLFKQILMVSGMEKYFQIVKCFRDEDLRADRQPEFTQVDLEMSFVEQDDVIALMEGCMKHLFKNVMNIDVQTPFPRMTFKDAMERFGTDKPDLRFGLELVEMADLAREGTFKVFLDAADKGGRVKALLGKGMASMSRKEIDLLTQEAQGYGAKGLAWIKVTDDGFESPIAKFFPEDTLKKMSERLEAEPGDLMMYVADKEPVVLDVLGRLRLSQAKKRNLHEDGFNFSWVVDYPLMEWDDDEQSFSAMHHPFTSPTDEDSPRLMEGDITDRDVIASLHAKAYDLVLNGFEIGGGSIRIHDHQVQSRMLELLGISPEEANAKFGFLLDALKFGAPPHGGMALGLDRLIMIMVGAQSIREVIAFPKTQKASCPLSGAPSSVDTKQLGELSIKLDVILDEPEASA